jgi:hypothetical protein
MTGKERLLATLAGERADRVPFVPNIWQWFHVHRDAGTLPADWADVPEPVEALRRLGADVMSKFDGVVLRPQLQDCRLSLAYEGDPADVPSWTSFADFEQGPIRRERIETPHGTLTHVWEYPAHAQAPFESEHWWKDFDREYAAVRAWMLDRRFELDASALQRGLTRIGDDGLLLLQLPPSPLKQFHWLAGQEQASFFLADHPGEMRALARIHEEQTLAVVEQVVDLAGVWAFEWPENLDSLFYSPPLFREFCLPAMRRAAGLIHARGKYMFAHACGRLKALAPWILEAGLDCVEGQAHPPLGDWRLDEARALSERLIVCGGMTAREQEWTGSDAAARIDRHVRDLFASLDDKRRFLFASGCNSSPQMPLANLLAFRDAALKYGSFC